MTIREALSVINDELEVPIGRLVIASGVLAESDGEHDVSLSDLLQCLRIAARFKSINAAQELAALALYRRTKRPRQQGHAPYEDFDIDPASWESYLKEHQLLR
jgi:hypothetical protein